MRKISNVYLSKFIFEYNKQDFIYLNLLKFAYQIKLR